MPWYESFCTCYSFEPYRWSLSTTSPAPPSLGRTCAGELASSLSARGAQSLSQVALVQGAGGQHHQRGQEEVGNYVQS